MRGVAVRSKASRQWLPRCVVLIQPQSIRDYLEDPAWNDILHSWDTINNEGSYQGSFRRAPDSLEGSLWSSVSNSLTTTTIGDLEVLSAVENNLSVADLGYENHRQESVPLTPGYLDWVTQPSQEWSGTIQVKTSTRNTEVTNPPPRTSEPAVTQLNYVDSHVNQPPLNSSDTEMSPLTQWLTLAEKLPSRETLHPQAAPTDALSDPSNDGTHLVQPPCDNFDWVGEFDWVKDFDWVQELPDLEAALQPTMSTYFEPSVTESSYGDEDSFFAKGSNGQSPLIEASQIQVHSAVTPSQGLYLSQQPSCTRTNLQKPCLPESAQPVNSAPHRELPSADTSTAQVADSVGQLAHAYGTPTVPPQLSQISTVSQVQLQVQEGPLDTEAAAAQKAESSPLQSSTRSEEAAISCQSSTARNQHQINTSQDFGELSPSVANSASQLPRASFDAKPHSLHSKQSRLDATQDQSRMNQHFHPIEPFSSASPARLGGFPNSQKRSMEEETSKRPQKAKRKRLNSHFFDFQAKLLSFVKATLLERQGLSDLMKGLSREDGTPLALMLRCFNVFAWPRTTSMKASSILEASPGQTPWIYHWLCYAFSPNNQSCILDFELKEGYVLPAVKPDDVSEQVWAVITNTTKPKQAQAFYNAIYQLYEAWKVERRRPPPVEETVLDEVIEERLQLCELPSDSLEAGVMYGRVYGQQWFMTLAGQVFHQKPIVEEATRPDDEFYQLMMGVAAFVALEPFFCQASARSVKKVLCKQMAVQLINIRYRGPNDEAAFDNVNLNPSGIRECVKRGYLKPELLMSVTSEVTQSRNDHDSLIRQRFILYVLVTSVNLFLKWSNLYEL
eukprot:Blabericola_migrator_1__1688@NODE_1454_length_4516_cov_17_561025_g329_i1_p1_GENE_NODE_1454_length_4516_cov_17_561025_g329_i1NODE_1454_length_4516_cov_17_561025_g329_i1_p1_ORF_typecomplete_len842_score112_77_NODE_1454_length_4516_cov_17_561025_g329_i14973022